MNQKGNALLIVLFSFIILLSLAGGSYYFINLVNSAKTAQNKGSFYEIKPLPSSQVLPSPSTEVFASSASANNLKPDLIIEKISYKKPEIRQEGYGVPRDVIAGNFWDFTITVKNIGKADFKDSFYVFNSRSESDFADNYHSHLELANQKEEKIPVNGTLNVTVSDLLVDDTKHVHFLINSRSKTDKKDISLKFKDELNYENNSYQLIIN